MPRKYHGGSTWVTKDFKENGNKKGNLSLEWENDCSNFCE